MKKLLSFLLALCMILSFAACDTAEEKDAAPTEPKETEPAETLPPLGTDIGSLCYGKELPIVTKDGETGDTIDPTKTGKVTVINFWGTWCGPCVSELPHLNELAKQYSETVTVVAIHSLEGYKKMPAYLGANYENSPIVFSWETTGEYNGDYFYQLGGGMGYPYTVVLDERGVITHTQVGMMNYEEMVSMVEEAGAVPNTIPSATVNDAYLYSFQYTNDNWTSKGYVTYCYHIPQVILPDDRAAAFNQMIYDTYYPIVEQVENRPDEYASPSAGIVYDMQQYGDVISLVVQTTADVNDLLSYDVFNLSATTGEILTEAQVYEALGKTQKEAEQILTSLMQDYCSRWKPSEYLSQDFIDSMTADTLAYMSEAKPFVTEQGQLGFAVKVAVPGAAGWNCCLIDEGGSTSSVFCTLPEHQDKIF